MYLSRLKHDVCSGNGLHGDNSYSYLIDEWRRSVESGVAQNTDILSDSHRDFTVFDRVTTMTQFRLSMSDDFIIKRENALAEIGCAIFYLDPMLAVYRTGGDHALLDELREKGIRHGTKFTQESVGVFVANQLSDKQRSCCRVGEENYLEVFTDYVCFAQYDVDEVRDFHGANLTFAPKNQYTNFLKTMVSFLQDSTLDLINMVQYPFLEQQRQLVFADLYDQNQLKIILDPDGDVVFASKEFEREFGKTVPVGLFENISTFMGDLAFAKKFFRHGQELVGRELLLKKANGRSHFYFAQFTPLFVEGELKGISCGLHRTDISKKAVGKTEGQEVRYSFSSIKGEAKSMLELKSIAMRVAKTGSNVLIQGESGTGKELLAQSVHSANERRTGPFVPVNCAAIPNELMSSELFGYESGAFTGALKGGYAGKFEQANGGTIFLDEVSEMPLSMQSLLLRVLEDSVISRIGGNRYIPLDVRVIAATNKDLWECAQKGTFRADLYFRLNIVKLVSPPLREHIEDLELLLEHMLTALADKGVSTVTGFSPEVIALFRGYSWPGNVRELRNVVERCVNFANGDIVTMDSLPIGTINMMRAQQSSNAAVADKAPNVQTGWQQIEMQRIKSLMIKYNGNKSKVAQELGCSRGTLYKRLKELDM